MQMWQQNMMYKQLQELQRQQQLQQLGEARQQNSLNQHSATVQQSAGGQLPLLINGTPVRDTPQMFTNLMQRGSSPSLQGVPNRQGFPPDQNQTMHSMGLIPQQLDVSLHGTPVGSAGGNMSQYSNAQGMSRDSMNFFTQPRGNQGQKPIMQSSMFGNSFPGDHGGFSSDNVCVSQEAFVSKQGFQMKNVFGQVPLQDENVLQINASLPEFNERQEQSGNREILQQSTAQLGTSQGLVPLDPLEQKILYNMDDNGWDTGFGRSMDIGAGGFGSAFDQSDYSSALQSGSWSALMLSAVAETSNSDTGGQEKWSGLTFQNTEVSTDNQPSNFNNEERQQTGWVDNKLQSASANSKPFPVFNDSSMKSNFPGFQQSGSQCSNEQQREGLRQYDSHESFQKSTRWLNSNPQQKPSNQISQQMQPMHSENAWAGQNYGHPESDAHQRRMASHNNVSQMTNEQKGDVNGTMDKGRSPDGYPWIGRLEQQNSRTDNLMSKDSQVNHFGSVPYAVTTKTQLEADKNTPDKPDYMKHVDCSMSNNENQSAGKTPQQRSSSSHTFNNSYGGASKTYENFDNKCDSKGFSGPKQGHLGPFNIAGNISENTMNLDKGCLPNFQGNKKVSDDGVYGDDMGSSTSTTFGRTVGSNCQNVDHETSQHMLDLLHKVDRSREDSPKAHFGSMDHNSLSEVPKADTHDPYNGQLFDQSSASQGFGLKLAPPSQRLPNSSRFLPSEDPPQITNNLNSRQVNSESGLKRQGWLDSRSSVRSLPPNEISQRAHWDDKSTNPGQTNVSSFLNMQVKSDATLTSSSAYVRNQPQVQHMPNARAVGESSQATPTGTSNRFADFNPVSSQDATEQTTTSPAQPFPVLETTSFSQPPVMFGMSKKGGMSATHLNSWKNVPTSRHPSAFPSIDPSKDSTENTSWSSQGLNDQNSLKGRIVSSDLGASSINSQGSGYGEEQPGKQRSRQEKEISSEICDSSQSGGLSEGQEPVVKHVPAKSNQQNPDRVFHGDNNVSAASERNLESFGRSLKASQTLHQNHNILHQMQAIKSARDTDSSNSVVKKNYEADGDTNVQQVNDISGKQSMYEHNSKNHSHIGPSSSQLNSFPSGDAKMPSFLTNAREELNVKSSSQPALQPSLGIGTFNQNNFKNQSGDAVYNHAQHSLVDARMAPKWFEQYGTIRNGQMLPVYNARPAKTAMDQFSFGKPSQNLPVDSSVGQIDAAVPRQVGSILPSQTVSLVSSKDIPAPYVSPSDLANQSEANVRAKRRKTIKSERIPWHKEVTQGFCRLQDISSAEQDWAHTTNRVIEKIEDDIELIGEEQPMRHRSKRRLILTTQLIQQLLRPAPASILLGDASSQYDSVTYFIAKVALGNACSLANCSRNELHAASDNSDMNSVKYQAFESDKHFAKVMEGFTERAKKLENDFVRLESSSILDIRVDCQDLERNSVINRFAKFHMRGQADTSGMSAPRPPPQRYVAAFPMPRNLPEGIQCLSL